MSVFSQKALNKEHVKVRWNEPYVSSALNQKDFGSKPRGIYAGFNIIPVGYRSYRVVGTEPLGFQGDPNTYNKGAYSSTSGYSVALFSDTFGHAPTIEIPPGAVSGEFEFDFTGVDDEQRIIALDAQYLISNITTGAVLAVDAAEMTANPEYLVIGVVNIPSDTVSASSSDIVFNDTTHPRTLPFADSNKFGYMSPQQASIVSSLSDETDSIYCSDNDANVWWRLFDVSGVGEVGRLDFDGNIALNNPTNTYNIQVSTSGTVVSGVEDGDVVFFTYATDGSVSSAELEIAPNNTLPSAPFGSQLSVFGIRCGNDFWFKNGQKWEAGELKPFGVTSKSPDLTVAEFGNPPGADSVSGIFFQNAQVTPRDGGRDVDIFINVSGALPDVPLEEEFLVTSLAGQNSFTTVDLDFFWIFDLNKTDITVWQNGTKLVQFTESTSGVTYSNGDPIWDYIKTGTRTIETRKTVPENGLITIRHEVDRGINAYEQIELIDVTSGVTEIDTDLEFNSSNAVHDIKVYRNGVKQQFNSLPLDPLIHSVTKISSTQLGFTPALPKNSVVVIRWEGSLGALQGTSGGGGDFWFDLVDSNLEPETDNTYDIGQSKRFRNANFGGDGAFEGDFYIGGKLNVSGGIDPLYLQLNPVVASLPPTNAIFVDSTTSLLTFKNEFGITEPINSGASGIDFDETELMTNPYPFDIEAPKAVSISASGNFFLLSDIANPTILDNYFGVLTENVSAFGSGFEIGAVQWRGKVPVPGTVNGALYVSGEGGFSPDAPSVSGFGILKTGIVKDEVLFIRPGDGFNL